MRRGRPSRLNATTLDVMAGLDPAIQRPPLCRLFLDGRLKGGHDARGSTFDLRTNAPTSPFTRLYARAHGPYMSAPHRFRICVMRAEMQAVSSDIRKSLELLRRSL
jgi:hypothetical protein